ncbi:Tripartite motif-containing protein 65-like [Scleropages formosus]|nr:uncharacterized protein LOC114910595 [Scleropages formosus]XP_029108262.1 uncharacterized protein LOC114910595 [Scleropages formosus]KPP57094.1 Tripartite motif-containing protein 65-like [Scleropages formosus]
MGDIAQELTCTVCLEIYREPHLLPCGHSFCLQCVRDLWRALDFRCPECRRECRDPGGVRKNHKLANIVDVYRLEQRAGRPRSNVDHTESRVAYWLLLTAVLLLFTAILLKQELEATTEELLDSQLQLMTLQNEDHVVSADLEPVGFGRTVLNFLLSLPHWAMWLLLRPFLMTWDLLRWLLSTVFHVIYLCLWLISTSLTACCELIFNLFNMVVYACGMGYIYSWVLRLLRRRTNR